MSTPVTRSMRVATGFVVSSAERVGCSRRRLWHRREKLSTPHELACAPAVGEEPEVADPDKAAREDVGLEP
jgi:hypothetical protein